jgi:starch synthase
MVEKKRPDVKSKAPVRPDAKPVAPKPARKAAAKPRSAPAAPRAPAAPKAPVEPKAAVAPKAPVKPRPAAKKAEPPREPPLSVLMVAPEFRPYVRNAGLALMAAGLPEALGRLGHRVTLVLPKYRGIDVTGARPQSVRLELGDRAQDVTFHTLPAHGGVTTVFVDVPDLFDRDEPSATEGMESPDTAWRFALFDRAALEYARLKGERPSVIHAHDWQTGLVAVFQKMHLSKDPVVGGVPAIFTIHNIGAQGVFPASTLPSIGLAWDVLDVQALEYWGQISYLKGGINFSEQITTAGRDAREVLTPELGCGMEGVLARRSNVLTGTQPVNEGQSWDASAREYVKVYRGAETKAEG